ncbi:hypothetical protein Q5752_003837 [Cryptotrichosporon argae]
MPGTKRRAQPHASPSAASTTSASSSSSSFNPMRRITRAFAKSHKAQEADPALGINDILEPPAKQPASSMPSVQQRSPPPSPATGRRGWKTDFEEAKQTWGGAGADVAGYAGLVATVASWRSGDADNSIEFKVTYEDPDGCRNVLCPTLAFEDISEYPASYSLIIYADDPSPAAEVAFSRFFHIYDMRLAALVQRFISAVQGDDDASGGRARDEDGTDDEDEDFDFGGDGIGRGFETAKGSQADFGTEWGRLQSHFQQAMTMGYRPGLTRISDYWVLSLSIPLKNMSIDPNTLLMWDDELVDAWDSNQRFTILVSFNQYPPHPDRLRYSLVFTEHYKPSEEKMAAATRVQKESPSNFFLSMPLTSHLRAYFTRCFKLRTSFALNWDDADRIGFDDDASRNVFTYGQSPKPSTNWDAGDADPVSKGFEDNIPLCAFYWALQRFINAPRHCVNCGLDVDVPSVRPYVCNKPLCLYAFMSLGLGPSIEHVVLTQPAVVDLLLSLAWSAAKSPTRMDLPLQLHIEVPPDAGQGLTAPTLLDNVADQRSALAWLIEQLPRVSVIRKHIEAGGALKDIDAPSGSIGVLRWVVGSCKAYLKETREGEGILNTSKGSTSTLPNNAYYAHEPTNVHQFSFVVGSPEQEANFKTEIALAQAKGGNVQKYPTILAFHVNVPATFVAQTPYYVVNNTKQIKPFLLLVTGKVVESEPEAEKEDEADQIATAPANHRASSVGVVTKRTIRNLFCKRRNSVGELFKHDPGLAMQSAYYNKPLQVRMPEKLHAVRYDDKEPNTPDDEAVVQPPAPPKPKRNFTPSDAERFKGLALMPPPKETSGVATKALGREMKELVKRQEEGSLPFWLHTELENTNLYCWVIEMFDFPSSVLMDQMRKHKVKSVIAELRFSAAFPHSSPFIRILHPRFMPFMHGGGGHITGGGSICHELLTASGWNPAYNIEAVVRDVMVNMTEAVPPARLDDSGRWNAAYTLDEAIIAYKRVAAAHGWEVPKDIDKVSESPLECCCSW